MKYILLLFTISFHGQVLHHQMLSSQGQTSRISSGIVVKQIIGQQSINGTSNNRNVVVMQGFQQSLWSNYIESNKTNTPDYIKTIIYPNPFTETINFQFSKQPLGLISIVVFDVSGRLVYDQKQRAINAVLTIDLSRLPTSAYLVRLSATNYNYYTKIIKK